MLVFLKELFLNCSVYKTYIKIKEYSCVKFFINYGFFKKCIFSVGLLNRLYQRFCEIKKDNIYVKDIYILAYIYLCAYVKNSIILFVYSSFLFVLFIFDDNYKEDSFLYAIISLVYLLVSIIIKIILGLNVFNIWTVITIFVILSIYLKKIDDEVIKKNLIIIFVISMIFTFILKVEHKYTLIMVIPFLIYYFYNIKRRFINFSVMAFIILFIFNLLIKTIQKVIKFGIDRVISDIIFYINKGLKGETLKFFENIDDIIKNNV